jgi:hypothetical protein
MIYSTFLSTSFNRFDKGQSRTLCQESFYQFMYITSLMNYFNRILEIVYVVTSSLQEIVFSMRSNRWRQKRVDHWGLG